MLISDSELQNPVGDPAAALAEFNMMENINLLILEHCNLACTHCGTGSPFAKNISHPVASFFKWLDLLESEEVPFKFISLTGGEPFLHPEMRNGSIVRKLRTRYPSKRVGVTTNFFWGGNEERMEEYAPMIGMMNGGLAISVYEPIIKKMGGRDQFDQNVQRLRELCPNTWITLEERKEFLAWEFREEQQVVTKPCATSDCFNLKPDGKLTHCSLGIAAQNIPRYASIVKRSEEMFLDLENFKEIGGKEKFMSWSRKYPFDVCSNCTMWEGKFEPWRSVR